VKGFQKICKKRGGWVLLFVLITLPFLALADDKTLYQKGSYRFTQENAKNLLELAEYIGGSRFSKKDRKALQLWSIEDFKAHPKTGMKFYRSLPQNLLPKIRKSKGNNIYRAELYLSYVDLFKKHPEYKKLPNNFLAVIDRYKPPIKEALQIRQIRFNSLMQQMQSNQRTFNQAMQSSQRSSDRIAKSLQDQSRRQSITLPGGTILRETGDKIYAEDYKGQKFEVAK